MNVCGLWLREAGAEVAQIQNPTQSAPTGQLIREAFFLLLLGGDAYGECRGSEKKDSMRPGLTHHRASEFGVIGCWGLSLKAAFALLAFYQLPRSNQAYFENPPL